MKKIVKKVIPVLISLTMLLGACGSDKTAESPKENQDVQIQEADAETTAGESNETPALEEVTTITMPVMITMNPCEDRDKVQEELNKKLLEKGYPVQVNFLFIDFSSWGQQIDLLLADGQIDLFNCSFMESMSSLAGKGAIAPLDDLLDKYGQGIKDTLGEYLVCGKIGGVTYGTPKYSCYGNAPMFIMNKEMLDKAGISRDDITDLNSLTDALRKVHEIYPDVTMISTGAGGSLYDASGLDWLGGDKAYACLKLDKDNTEMKVINYYATDDFKDLLDITKVWVDEGFIRKDAINYQDASFSALHDQSAFGTFAGYANEEICDSVYASSIAYPTCSAQLDENAWITTGNVNGMTWCIPALSKNQEAAMIFLNAMYVDPDISNIVCNGIEGVHYVVTDQGNLDYVDPETQSDTTSGWPSGMGSFWPNMLIAYPWAPDTQESYAAQIQSNEESLSSPALGFVFDPTNVSDQVAAVNNVMSKYYNPLMLHQGDTDELLSNMLKELEQAGVNDIITEKQKQLDEWLAENK